MLRTLLLVLLATFAASHALFECADQRLCDKFHSFKLRYGKQYASEDEERRRFSVFASKLREAEELSRLNPTATFGITPFSDMTTEEFEQQFLSQMTAEDPAAEADTRRQEVWPVRDLRALPIAFNTPYFTPVKNQGQCGSCWAFAAAQVVEAAWQKAGNANFTLSPGQITGCANGSPYNNLGCNGGNVGQALAYVKASAGLMLESTFPYPSTTYSSGVTPSCPSITGTVATINAYSSYKFVETVGSGIDQTLYQGSAIAIALYATPLQTYTGGVFTCATSSTPNHAVLLTGWGTDAASGSAYWTVKNSWGSKWGEKGYFRLKRGVGACSVTMQSVYGAASPAGTPCTSTSCPAGTSCSNGVCIASGCTPKTASVACASQTCGFANDGCGNSVTCGTCASGSVCSGGACVASTGWTNFYGGSNSFSLDSTGTVATYNGNSASKLQGFAWNSSSAMLSDAWNAFTCMVTASSGVVALGLRLGQTTGARDSFYWSINLGTGSVQLCIVYYGSSYCSSAGKLSGWKTSGANNVTVTAFLSSGVVYSMPFVNGAPLSTAWQGYSKQYFSSTGLAFILASGSSTITFASPRLQTRTSGTVTLAQSSPCITPSAWALYVSQILGISTDLVVSVNVDEKCGVDGATGETSASRLSFSLLDSYQSSTLADGTIAGGVVDNVMYSNELATNLQNVISGGGFVTGPFTVASLVLNAETAAAGVSGGLSTGAIVGIVVGSVVGSLLVLALLATAVVVGAIVIAKMMPEPAEPMPATYRPGNPLRKTLYKFYSDKGGDKGVDVMSTPERTGRSSITARSPPQSV